MKRTPLAVLVCACLTAACVSGGHGTGVNDRQGRAGSARSEGSTQLAEGSGRDITLARCPVCHGLEYIPMNAPVMNRAAWQKTVQKMRVAFGAPISDDEAQNIVDYLGEHYSELR